MDKATTPKTEPTWKHIPDKLLELSLMVRLNREGYEQIWLHLGECEVCRDRLWEVTERQQKRVEGLASMSRSMGAVISGLMSAIDKSSETVEESAGRSLFEFLNEGEEDETPSDMKKDLEEAGFTLPAAFVKKVLTMLPDPDEEGVKTLFMSILDKTAKLEEYDTAKPEDLGLRFNRPKEHMLTCMGCQARVISTLQLCAHYQDKVDTDERRKGLERLKGFLKTYQAEMFKDIPIETAEESEAAPPEKNRVFTQP